MVRMLSCLTLVLALILIATVSAQTAPGTRPGTTPGTRAATAPATHPATGTAPAAAPATGPATTQASTQPGNPDYSTPKATLRTLCDLLLSGDIDAVKKCFATPTTSNENVLLESGLMEEFYNVPLFYALREKFPKDADKIKDPTVMIEKLKSILDKAEEKIDGARCTIKTPNLMGPPPEIKLVLQAGDWKLEVLEGRFLKKVPPGEGQYKAGLQALMQTALADVRAGKFANISEAMKVIDARRRQMRLKNPARDPNGPPD